MTVIRRVRNSYIKERTGCRNRIGSMLLEFGISLPKGHHQMKNVFQRILDSNELFPSLLLLELKEHFDYYNLLNEKFMAQETKLQKLLDEQVLPQLLQTIPGIGPITAACCVSSVGDARDFKNGRAFATWIGLVPFVHAARAVMWRDESAEKYFGSWLIELKRRKPFNVAVVALANKIARIAWSIMAE